MIMPAGGSRRKQAKPSAPPPPPLMETEEFKQLMEPALGLVMLHKPVQQVLRGTRLRASAPGQPAQATADPWAKMLDLAGHPALT